MAGAPTGIKSKKQKVQLYQNILGAHSAEMHTGEICFYYVYDKHGKQIGGALVGTIHPGLIKSYD